MLKIIKYYIVLIISVFDLVIAMICGSFGILTIVNANKRIAFNNSTKGLLTDDIIVATYFGTMIVTLTLYPLLTKLRQKLRDQIEYDNEGIYRKKCRMSQLSRKERDSINRQLVMDRERILPTNELRAITHKGSKNSMAEIDKLIGLDNVKYEIKQFEARMAYEKDKRKHNKNKMSQSLPANHMIFAGNPGTGKTTIARIVTGLLYKYGYIKKNQYIEIDGNFFDSVLSGESVRKAAMLLKVAKGGVLFIDEADSLLAGNSKEVIPTIVKEMEDQRSDLIIILAGYKKEMEQLINSNPGIESRIKYHIDFKDFNEQELARIFISMANEQNLVVSQDLLNAFIPYIVKLSQQPNFGNARTVRNILDKIIDKHAMNIKNGYIEPDDKFRLMPCDMI